MTDRSRPRRRFRISLRFLLRLTLLIAFYFLGWSTHQSVTHDQYQRDQFTAKKLQDQWMEETEMIRRSISSPPANAIPSREAMRLLDEVATGSGQPAAAESKANGAGPP